MSGYKNFKPGKDFKFIETIPESAYFQVIDHVLDMWQKKEICHIKFIFFQKLAGIYKESDNTCRFSEEETLKIIQKIHEINISADTTGNVRGAFNPRYHSTYYDIRDLSKEAGQTLHQRVMNGSQRERAYLRQIDPDVFCEAIGPALCSNYPNVVRFLFNDVARYEISTISPDTAGESVYQTISKTKAYLGDYRDALAEILSPEVPKKSQPGLFWVGSALKEVLSQMAELEQHWPDQVDLAQKAEQLSAMQDMLGKHLVWRLEAGDKLTDLEKSALRLTELLAIAKPCSKTAIPGVKEKGCYC